jgi:hypothetical protein
VKERWRLSARDNNQPVSLESLVKRFRMKMCARVKEQQKPVVLRKLMKRLWRSAADRLAITSLSFMGCSSRCRRWRFRAPQATHPAQNAIVIIYSLRLQTLPSRKQSPCPGHILWHPSRRLGKVL